MEILEFDVSKYPFWFYSFRAAYFLNVGDKFPFLLPTYGAPDASEEIPPLEVISWRDASVEGEMPAVVDSWSQDPLTLNLDASDESMIGVYKFDVNIYFEKYGTL